MIVFILIELSLLLAVIFIKPYTNQVVFAKDIITQSLFPVIYVTFMVYKLNNFNLSQQTTWGYVDIFTITIIIVMNLVVMLIESYHAIRQLWIDYKKFKEPIKGTN